jgi:hypothetical protein
MLYHLVSAVSGSQDGIQLDETRLVWRLPLIVWCVQQLHDSSTCFSILMYSACHEASVVVLQAFGASGRLWVMVLS